MDVSDKVRENRLRRMAERQGLALLKSRRRDPRAIDYDCWIIVGSDNRIATERPMMSLDDVEAFLESPLIVELRRAGRAYVESRGANRDALRSLVYEATKTGVQPGAVEFVTGVPLETIMALNREANEGE